MAPGDEPTAEADSPAEFTTAQKSSLLSTALLLSLGAMGIVARLLLLSRQSASVDEVSEVAIASSPNISDVVLAADGFPPLYNLLLRAVIAVTQGLTGDPVTAALPAREVMAGRFMSAVFGIAALVPMYLFARRLVGKNVAVVALLLAASSPILIWYSQESRAYSLFVLLACCALALFYRAAETDETIAWVGFLVVCILGSLTHYYFPLLAYLLLFLEAGIPLAGAAVDSGKFEQRKRQPRKRMLITFAALTTSLALPIYLLRADLSHQTQYGDSFSVSFDPMSFGYTFFTFLHGAAIGPSVRRLHSMSGGQAAREFLPWLMMSGAFLLLAAAGLWLNRKKLLATGPRQPSVHLMTLALVPVLAAGSASLLFGVHYKPSYSLWSVVPLLILLSLGIDWLGTVAPGRYLKALALTLFLVLTSIGVTNRNFVPDHENEELGELSAYMETHAHPEDVNLVMTAYVGAHLRRSFRKDWKIYLVSNAGCDDERLSRALSDAEEALAQATRPDHRLIYSRPFHGDPCSRFIDSFHQRHELRLEAIFSGIEVYQIE